nr:cyclopropane-fatty-acyl-phospholipid synthase family protein [Ramlibacter tataouinensis]
MIEAAERAWVPDTAIRAVMRGLMRRRLAEECAADPAARSARFTRLVEELRASPIARDTQAANAQHYEVPSEFFRLHLGPRLKYSSAYFATGGETLAEAEEAMLELYAQRAGLGDGQRILDLGCGWGSLSLWLAERFPYSQIVGLSNSHGQRGFIEARAAQRGLTNLRIVTADVAQAQFPLRGVHAGFDRVVSVEMFEHMKNYRHLFQRVASWMAPQGQMLVHVFAHPTLAYHFESRDASDWMARHFFTGGLMPSSDLFLHFQEDLCLRQRWWIGGQHYERTANAWLAGMDREREAILAVFRRAYGADQAERWFQRWRMFYMAVAELFGFEGGRQWGVAHYLFDKRG